MELETTLENLKLVAAVVDVQGFSFTSQIENEEVIPHFLVREFAAVSLSSQIRLEYDVPEIFKSGFRNKRGAVHEQTKLVHGLTFRPTDKTAARPSYLFREDLVDVCGLIVTPNKPVVAVRNDFLVKHLRELQINFVNLCKGPYSVPNQQQVRRSFDAFRACELHMQTQAFRIYNCAVTKSKSYIHWIKDQINSYDEPDGFGNQYLGNVQAGAEGEPSGVV